MIPKESEIVAEMESLGATYLGMYLNRMYDPYEDCLYNRFNSDYEAGRRAKKGLAVGLYVYGTGTEARVYLFEGKGTPVELPHGIKGTTYHDEPEGKQPKKPKSLRMRYSEKMRHT